MYKPAETRYDSMIYRHSGESGLKLPAVSLGLWHNFGSTGDYSNMKRMLHTAFDLGITHFNKSVKYIKSTYKNPNEKEVYEIHFVGFEAAETTGIFGFKIYSNEKEISVNYMRNLFSELFFQER